MAFAAAPNAENGPSEPTPELPNALKGWPNTDRCCCPVAPPVAFASVPVFLDAFANKPPVLADVGAAVPPNKPVAP